MTDANGDFVLAHCSDIHLGYHSGRRLTKQGVNWREADGYSAFHAQNSAIIADHEVDAVLIAGDLFHFPDPSNRAIAMAQMELRRLSDAGKPVYILTGNHDVSDIKSDLAATALVNDPDRHIYSHWEPYVVHEIGDGILLHMVSHHLFREQASTWDEVVPKDGAINIFTTHGAIVDPITKMQLHTEQSPREVVIPEEIEKNPGWSYRLLGHIHERGFVGSSNGTSDTGNLKTYYNGSLVRRGFSDADTPLHRGWTKWTIKSNSLMVPEFKTIAQRPQVDFPPIDATTLSASDITDVIIENLAAVKPKEDAGSDVHDDKAKRWSTAPILRQKVYNIQPDKKRAVDSVKITEAADFALSWTLNMVRSENVDDGQERIGALSLNGSLADTFNDWLVDSKEWKGLHESIRESVEKDTKGFIAQGQEKALDDK